MKKWMCGLMAAVVALGLTACGGKETAAAWTKEQGQGIVDSGSAGATCEEAAVLIFDSEDHAKAAAETLSGYVQDQIDQNRDYRPAEVPKLENKWLEQRGNTVLLVVANDLKAAQDAVK